MRADIDRKENKEGTDSTWGRYTKFPPGEDDIDSEINDSFDLESAYSDNIEVDGDDHDGENEETRIETSDSGSPSVKKPLRQYGGAYSDSTRQYMTSEDSCTTATHFCCTASRNGKCTTLRGVRWQNIQAVRKNMEEDRIRFGSYGLTPAEKLFDVLRDKNTDYNIEHEKDPATINQHTFLPWLVGTKQVCFDCWSAAAGFRTNTNMVHIKTTAGRVLTCYNNGDTQLPLRETNMDKPAPMMAQVIAWLANVVRPATGEAQYLTTDRKSHLHGYSKEKLRSRFKEDTGSDISQSHFTRAFNSMNESKEFPHVQLHKHKTQQSCAVCVAFRLLEEREKRARDKGSPAWIDRTASHKLEEQQHKEIAQLERIAERAREEASKAKNGTLTFSADGFCSRKTSIGNCHGQSLVDMKGQQDMNGAHPYTFKTQGILSHGHTYGLYVLDPTISANANFNIECLHRELRKHFDKVEADPTMDWPTEFNYQVDGAPDNKCKALFGYMEWLVRTGVFDIVRVSFLIVGHTHNLVDQTFVALTYQLREVNVKSLEDILQAYRDAYKTNKPVIQHVESVCDWTKWLVPKMFTCGGFNKRVPDHQRPHQFIASICATEEQTPEGCRSYRHFLHNKIRNHLPPYALDVSGFLNLCTCTITNLGADHN